MEPQRAFIEGSRLLQFRPVLCTQDANNQFARMLNRLALIQQSSILVIRELTGAINELKSRKPLSNVRSFTDRMRLQLYYSILCDVIEQQWKIREINVFSRSITLETPVQIEKEIIRKSMVSRRQELIERDKKWIINTQGWIGEHIADGNDVDVNHIIPEVEVCQSDHQKAIFRYLRYTWSSPYSEYVGRRIRILIRDAGQKRKPVIGIAALGSSIMQIAERDQWIGWLPNNEEEEGKNDISYWKQMRLMRADRIISMMDMYVCGSIPPYSFLTGGKLICYIMASNEIRDIFHKKYKNKPTIVRNRTSSELALLCTTSLYGSNSSQYNRITYRGKPLYLKVGETRGFGSLHVSESTFELMRSYLNLQGINLSYSFGKGVNWKMRVIRTALGSLMLDDNLYLQHTFPRSIYISPYAQNAKEYLTGKAQELNYYHRPMTGMIRRWKNRWLQMRLSQSSIRQQFLGFKKEELFVIPK